MLASSPAETRRTLAPRTATVQTRAQAPEHGGRTNIEMLVQSVGSRKSWGQRRLTGSGRLVVTAALLLAMPAHAANPKSAAPEQAQEAVIVSKQAKAYFDRGQYALAAELYRRAYEIDRSRPEFLFAIGRAEQKAGRLREALAAFEQLLTLLPVSNPLHIKAKVAVTEIRLALSPVPAQQPEQATPAANQPQAPTALPVPVTPSVDAKVASVPTVVVAPVRAPAETEGSRAQLRRAGWIAGALGLAAAGGLAVVAGIRDAQLADDKGKITGDQARDRQGTINGLSTAAAVCGAVGLGGLALGWWYLGDGPRVQVGADARQVWLAWRF